MTIPDVVGSPTTMLGLLLAVTPFGPIHSMTGLLISALTLHSRMCCSPAMASPLVVTNAETTVYKYNEMAS